MPHRRLVLLSLAFWALALLITTNAGAATTPANVILVTLDGVRWQEFLGRPDPTLSSGDADETFPSFWSTLAPQGFVFGNPLEGERMTIANPWEISLPAYQSIMAGRTQSCILNSCGRIKAETFPERLVREFGLPAGSPAVATISSWRNIMNAAEHVEGATFVNSGLVPLQDGTDDAEHARINSEQMNNPPPWHNARYDRYTFAHAKHFLVQHRPRFLFLSFDDSDEHGHLDQYGGYLGALRRYDGWLTELVALLDSMGDYGKNTTLIVTTDHGRGLHGRWKHHPFNPEARRVWMYARPAPARFAGAGPSRPKSVFSYTHLDIRPTIEAIFGLTPLACKHCGHVIREIVSGR